jgi:fluoride exporter
LVFGAVTPVTRTALVAAGGLVGSVARYWVSGLVQRLDGATFPVGTLAVNVLGSFVVALVMELSLERGIVGANLRILLTIGFCGGFTTMSTFSWETMALARDGELAFAGVNVVATLGACFAAAAVPHFDALLEAVGCGGLITLERAEIIKYTHGGP